MAEAKLGNFGLLPGRALPRVKREIRGGSRSFGILRERPLPSANRDTFKSCLPSDKQKISAIGTHCESLENI